ncbi:hypothetical protein FEM48_Zijuj08G0186600 [Ziziphus jujuba var. spinosa]|uniref:ATP-dependent DNA helicase n=1 Tax=Ziziphus jujuba var. spinosa TaxID=714518 RepID=A0A978V0Q5_ZIZJJ|nr:hypothetical protein FEM48_Zijuj08G0186600 [Ziziphus jujuba var. spinosa]
MTKQALRSKGKIVLTLASSGIAILLLSGGKITHSRFVIPFAPNEYSTCNVKQGSALAELIAKTELIIWDKAPMMNSLDWDIHKDELKAFAERISIIGDGAIGSLNDGHAMINISNDLLTKDPEVLVASIVNSTSNSNIDLIGDFHTLEFLNAIKCFGSA